MQIFGPVAFVDQKGNDNNGNLYKIHVGFYIVPKRYKGQQGFYIDCHGYRSVLLDRDHGPKICKKFFIIIILVCKISIQFIHSILFGIKVIKENHTICKKNTINMVLKFCFSHFQITNHKAEFHRLNNRYSETNAHDQNLNIDNDTNIN